MEAAIAGDYGVPTVLVAGDSAGVAEARALIPGLAGIVVKEAQSEAGAFCYPGPVTAQRIREAAAQAVREGGTVRPLRIASPVQLEVVLRDGRYLQAMRRLFPAGMADDRTLRVEGANVTAVWAAYWRMKLQAQREMTGKG
jgi:D-amino peptidase